MGDRGSDHDQDGVATGSPGQLRLRLRLAGADGAVHDPSERSAAAIEALGPLLVGMAELGKQVVLAVPEHPQLGRCRLVPESVRADDGSSAELLLRVRSVPGLDHGGLQHLVTTLAEQIAADYGLTVRTEVVVDQTWTLPADQRQGGS